MTMRSRTAREFASPLFLSLLTFISAYSGEAQEQPAQPFPVQPALPTTPESQQPRRVAPAEPQLFAQTPETTTRIVPLEFADPQDLMNVLTLFNVQVIPNAEPRALVLSGAESAVELAVSAVQQLDVPPPPVKNVEVIVYLIVASKGGTVPQNLDPIQPQLDPVTTQLSQVFGFDQFGLVDTILLRGRDGSSVETSGVMPNRAYEGESNDEVPSNYQVEVSELRVQPAPDSVARISLNGFMFGTDIAYPSGSQQGPNGQVFRRVERRDMGLRADLDVQEGQLAVVGKANLSAEGDVVFVVVTAQVVSE